MWSSNPNTLADSIDDLGALSTVPAGAGTGYLLDGYVVGNWVLGFHVEFLDTEDGADPVLTADGSGLTGTAAWASYVSVRTCIPTSATEETVRYVTAYGAGNAATAIDSGHRLATLRAMVRPMAPGRLELLSWSVGSGGTESGIDGAFGRLALVE